MAVVSENGGGSLAPALAGAFFVFFVHFVEAVSVSVAFFFRSGALFVTASLALAGSRAFAPHFLDLHHASFVAFITVLCGSLSFFVTAIRARHFEGFRMRRMGLMMVTLLVAFLVFSASLLNALSIVAASFFVMFEMIIASIFAVLHLVLVADLVTFLHFLVGLFDAFFVVAAFFLGSLESGRAILVANLLRVSALVVALLLCLLGLFDAFAVVAAFVAGLAEVHVALVVALMNIVAQKRAVVGYAFIVLIARELGTFFIWAATIEAFLLFRSGHSSASVRALVRRDQG